MIKFELTKDAPQDAIIPRRSTKASAGYDFFAPNDIALQPRKITPVIFTNVKVKLPMDKFLKIENRSSMMKKGVMTFCSGVIDADYYGNEENDGNIGVAFFNNSDSLVIIKKGDKICQGVIQSYYVTFNDACHIQRKGGFGSTGA